MFRICLEIGRWFSMARRHVLWNARCVCNLMQKHGCFALLWDYDRHEPWLTSCFKFHSIVAKTEEFWNSSVLDCLHVRHCTVSAVLHREVNLMKQQCASQSLRLRMLCIVREHVTSDSCHQGFDSQRMQWGNYLAFWGCIGCIEGIKICREVRSWRWVGNLCHFSFSFRWFCQTIRFPECWRLGAWTSRSSLLQS